MFRSSDTHSEINVSFIGKEFLINVVAREKSARGGEGVMKWQKAFSLIF
jgi:hypothetical protein